MVGFLCGFNHADFWRNLDGCSPSYLRLREHVTKGEGMIKRLAGFMLVGVLALGLVGCSGNSGTTSEPKDNNNSAEQAQSNEPQDLILADSNYVLSNGYVEYALEIQNPNDDYAADFVTVTVTSKHADGSIGFSDEWVVSNILPGSTSYWASQAGDGDTIESDNVEISLSVSDHNWNKTDQTMPADLYTFDNVTVAPGQFSGLTAKGEITLNEDFSYGTEDGESPMLVCILKDANGAIVAGFSGYMNSDLTVGTPSVFDIDSMFDAVEYTTAEMYANMWM